MCAMEELPACLIVDVSLKSNYNYDKSGSGCALQNNLHLIVSLVAMSGLSQRSSANSLYLERKEQIQAQEQVKRFVHWLTMQLHTRLFINP